MDQITKEQKQILKHTLGLDGKYVPNLDGDTYRNRFIAGEGHTEMPILEELVKRGFMAVREAPEWVCGDYIFSVTEKGKELVMPKPVRHEDGKLHNYMVKGFRCECGGNVFHKPDDTDLTMLRCNSCSTLYRNN